jgi:hypothetical protein
MLITVNLYRATYHSAGDARCAPIAPGRDKVGHRASRRQVSWSEVNTDGPEWGDVRGLFDAIFTDL